MHGCWLVRCQKESGFGSRLALGCLFPKNSFLLYSNLYNIVFVYLERKHLFVLIFILGKYTLLLIVNLLIGLMINKINYN